MRPEPSNGRSRAIQAHPGGVHEHVHVGTDGSIDIDIDIDQGDVEGADGTRHHHHLHEHVHIGSDGVVNVDVADVDDDGPPPPSYAIAEADLPPDYVDDDEGLPPPPAPQEELDDVDDADELVPPPPAVEVEVAPPTHTELALDNQAALVDVFTRLNEHMKRRYHKVRQIFSDGNLTPQAFGIALMAVGLELSPQDVQLVCGAIDTNSEGQVSMTELYQGIFKYRNAKAVAPKRTPVVKPAPRVEQRIHVNRRGSVDISEGPSTETAPAISATVTEADLSHLTPRELTAMQIKVLAALDQKMKHSYSEVRNLFSVGSNGHLTTVQFRGVVQTILPGLSAIETEALTQVVSAAHGDGMVNLSSLYQAIYKTRRVAKEFSAM